MEEQKLLWQPGKEWMESSEMKRFIQWLKQEKNKDFDHYQTLWQWSIDELETFWECIWEFYEVQHDGECEEVLNSRQMPGAKWFSGTAVNYAEHIFRQASDQRPALIHTDESGQIHQMGWQDLKDKVRALQAYLQEAGVEKGDRVVGFLKNTPEATIAFLATSSLGAIWSVCAPEFGVHSVVNRFSQIEPKIFIAHQGYSYHGKYYDRTQELTEITHNLPTLEKLILIPDSASPESPTMSVPLVDWNQVLAQPNSRPLSFERVPFNDPLWVLYSSGTTGIPKAITQSQGGVLIEHLKYMGLHANVKPGDRFFWYSTTGWMMWNILQASLLMGATAILYDGSPAYPTLDKLWDLAGQTQMTTLGLSASFIHTCMKGGLKPGENHDLSALRCIGSTGSVLTRPGFEWVYENVKSDLWLASITGGTDICGVFVGSNPMLPVYSGTLQCTILGFSLFAFDESAQPVINQPGEMVITLPAPSMPIYFWGDEDNRRYLSSYFEMYPGYWRHGDRMITYENGSTEILGRSDSTLNRYGVRIGTSEIYQLVEKNPQIEDSLVVNLEMDNGEFFMPLFVKLKDQQELTDKLVAELKSSLRKEASPRHVPNQIIQVEDIPYTLSGKKMEIPIKRILKGEAVHKVMNRDAMKNPAGIDFFVRYAEKLKEVKM